MTTTNDHWLIFRGDGLGRPTDAEPHPRLADLPPPPPWRDFAADPEQERAAAFQPDPDEIEKVNAALYLRRPLLITGDPGTGKTSLTYAVARELGLGRVLRWSITSRSTLQDGLYRYDAIARLQDTPKGGDRPPIGDYLALGPLGSAFFPVKRYRDREGREHDCPRVLLIDEIDKSDIDLPNDLLHIFEEGRFEIPELRRLRGDTPAVSIRLHESDREAEITNGEVRCAVFPLVVMTSNGEREFPPAFLRRCLHLQMGRPQNTEQDPKLTRIVAAHLGLGRDPQERARIERLIGDFLKRRDGERPTDPQRLLAIDQLLNAIYLTQNGLGDLQGRAALMETLWRSLSDG